MKIIFYIIILLSFSLVVFSVYADDLIQTIEVIESEGEFEINDFFTYKGIQYSGSAVPLLATGDLKLVSVVYNVNPPNNSTATVTCKPGGDGCKAAIEEAYLWAATH